jgi:MFS family permease
MNSATTSAASSLKPPKLWTGPFILFIFISSLSSTATQMVTPLMSTYLKNMHAGQAMIGFIVGLLSFAALFARPFSGAANDLLNRKIIMFASSLLVGLCVLAYAVSSNISLVIAIRILHGFAFSFAGTASMAFAATFIPRERFGEGMGYMGLAQIVAVSIGPSAGVYITDNFGATNCFMIAAALSIVAAFIILTVPYQYVKRQRPAGYRFQIRLKDLFAKELFVLSAFVGIFSIGNGMVNAFLKPLADERQILNVGLYFTANAVMMIAVRPFVGRLLDKKGLNIIMVPAYIIASAAMFFIGNATATWMLIAAGILKAIGQGSGAPSIQAEAVKMLGKERSGVASSTCFIGADVGNVIGPWIGGVTNSISSYATTFNGYAVFLLMASAAFSFYSKTLKKKEKAAELNQTVSNA